MKNATFIFFLFLSIQAFAQKKDVGFLKAQQLFETKNYYEALYEFQSVKTYDQGEEDFKNRYIAQIYTILDNAKEARPYIEQLKTNDKTLLLAKNFLQNDSLAKAVVLLQEVCTAQPNNAEAHYLLGNALYSQKQYEEAYKHLTEAKKIGLVTDEINKHLGVCAYALGEYIQAIVFLEEAKKNLNNDVLLQNYLGMSYFNVARKDLAILTLKNGLKQHFSDKKSAELAVNLALIYEHLELPDSTIHFLKQAITIDEERVDAYYFLGNSYFNLKMYNQSQFYLEKLLKINPNYDRAYYTLANAYFLDQLYEKAITRYRESSFFKKNSVEELHFIGMCYMQTQETAKASSYFEEAIKVDAHYLPAHINLALIRFHEKKYDEAISFLTYAQQLSPNNPDLLFLLAKTYLQLQNTVEAKYYFKETIRFNALEKKAYLYLGHLSLMENKLEEANFYYDMLLTFTPNHAEANLYRGICTYLQKEYDKASQFLMKASEFAENKTQAQYQLAKNYIKQGDFISSYGLVEQLLISTPNDSRLYYLQFENVKALGIKDEIKWYKTKIKAVENVY